MDRKGGMNSMQVIVLLVAMVIAGASIYGVWNITADDETTTAATIAGQALTETGIEASTAKVSCPSDSTTDGQVRYEDTLASTNTYLAPTCYFVPKTSGQERVTAGSLQTDGTYSTAVDLPCTTSGTKWRVVCVTSQDTAMSVDEGVDFTASGPFVKRDVLGKAIDTLKFKVEDKVTGGASFFNVTSCVASPSQSYVDFNGTQCSVVNDAGTTGTSLTLGSDEYIDARIYVKTNHTKRQFGEDGLRTWLLVNANADEFDEPIVSRDSGATLVDNLANMAAEDIKHYAGYEYAYDIGSIGDRESYIDFYMETAAGVNPSTDPVVDFCAEGRYNSNKQKDTVLTGCWTDAATQVDVFTTYLPQFKFDIS